MRKSAGVKKHFGNGGNDWKVCLMATLSPSALCHKDGAQTPLRGLAKKHWMSCPDPLQEVCKC